MFGGVVNGCMQNESSHWVQIVGKSSDSEAFSLERNASPARCWIKHKHIGDLSANCVAQDRFLFRVRRVLEGSAVSP